MHYQGWKINLGVNEYPINISSFASMSEDLWQSLVQSVGCLAFITLMQGSLSSKMVVGPFWERQSSQRTDLKYRMALAAETTE